MPAFRSVTSLGLLAVLAGCGRLGYEPVGEAGGGAVRDGAIVGNDAGLDGSLGFGGSAGAGASGTSGAGAIGASEAGASSGGSGPGGSGGGGAGGSAGAPSSGGAGGGPPMDAGVGAGGRSPSGGDAGTPEADGSPVHPQQYTSCLGDTAPDRLWSFDAGVESWHYRQETGTVTFGWSGTEGNPVAGALVLDSQQDMAFGWAQITAPAQDLSGRVLSMWVYLDSGASIGLKAFAQSEAPRYGWADMGYVVLSPGTWTCMFVDFDDPAYAEAAFDATRVVRMGLEVVGTGRYRLIVDQAAQ